MLTHIVTYKFNTAPMFMFKDAMPVSLGQNCLHLTSKLYLGSETYSRKYVKLQFMTIICS